MLASLRSPAKAGDRASAPIMQQMEMRGPRRHAHRLGCADRDERRRGAARRRVSPGPGGPLSRHPELRPLCQGARLPGGLQERVDAHDRGLSGDRARLEQPLPELGAGRSGEMGAGRIRDRAGRFARRRPLARPPRGLVAARGAGSPRLRRMGRHPALVERQGRPQRHLLLRHEPVARGAAAAAAPGGAVHLGRLVRLLSRARAPRRHPLRLPEELVAPAGGERAARGGRARPEEPGHRRMGGRPRHARRRRNWRASAPTSPPKRRDAA